MEVTFAGSPDRVEARLVPEAGFAFDAFRVSGLPRRPGVELARALLVAARAPEATLRILRRRRPHVVLGGGGYVSGPMVLAAVMLRLPAALLEADAHLGLANRLAAPFARRVFLSFPLTGRDGAKYRDPGQYMDLGASRWMLVFDTETTVDPGQSLRVGAYQLRRGSRPARRCGGQS